MIDIIKFLEKKQQQLTREALMINDALISYQQGEVEYTKQEVEDMCYDRDHKEDKAIFLAEILDEIQDLIK